jgi:hypothetical protein
VVVPVGPRAAALTLVSARKCHDKRAKQSVATGIDAPCHRLPNYRPRVFEMVIIAKLRCITEVHLFPLDC